MQSRPPASAAKSPSAPPNVTVDINVGQDSPAAVLEIFQQLDAQKVTQVKERTLNGMETVVAGVLVLKRLASLIVRVLPLWKCGVVVDARGSRILTEKNCDLPSGTVLVIHPDGKRSKVEKPSEAQMESLVADFVPRK